MPRLASQNKEIKDERRQSILNASLVVFALYGKDNTTVDLLTTASKCSHGLFYHYFKNVDQVYDSLFKLPKLIVAHLIALSPNFTMKATIMAVTA